MLKRVAKKILLERNEYVKEQYLEYLSSNNVLGVKGNIKKAIKLLELNMNTSIEEMPKEKELFSKTVEELVKEMENYDVVSFDIFDTLVFRKFRKPTDVFLYMEAKYSFPGFSKMRVLAEENARKNKVNSEIFIWDIYDEISKVSSIDKNIWMRREIEAEKDVCFANPYMIQVFSSLRELGKTIIFTSDMYLPEVALNELLISCGYSGQDAIFVSCEMGKSKWNGDIFGEISKRYAGKMIVHIGDNMMSDVTMAQQSGWSAIYYPNVASITVRKGLGEMSTLTRSTYEALLNTHLYNGSEKHEFYYRYGFEYGGIIAAGYCQWLRKKVDTLNIDKVFFVARDGYILKKIFDKHFPDIPSEYIPFSRYNSHQIVFERDINSYLEQVLYPRVNKKMPISAFLKEVDLELLEDYLQESGLQTEDILNDISAEKLVSVIYKQQIRIKKYFAKTQKATLEHLSNSGFKNSRVAF